MLSRLFGALTTSPDYPYGAFFERFIPDVFNTPGATEEELARCERSLGHPMPAPLRQLLSYRNGGTFNKGLFRLMGACRPSRQDDLAAWNDPDLWKQRYETINLAPLTFFASDIFGNQFGYLAGDYDPVVWRFDVQEGDLIELSVSMTEFFTELLPENGPWLLGADLRDAYDESGLHRELGQHLGLVTPSLLGGSMAPENLQPVDPWVNLYVTGQLVTQVKPLPSGTTVNGLGIDPATLLVTLGLH